MAGEAFHRHAARASLEHRLGLARSADADGVAEGDLVAAHVVKRARHLGHSLRR